MKKLGSLWLVLLVSITMAFGQATEICNNGIDDDGDGFIDCYDSKCANNAACAGGFLNNNILCQAKPPAFPQFTMKLKWQSPNKTTNHLNRASVGDLDRDGIPEVVVNEIQNRYIYILNGANGTIKKSLQVGYSLQRDPLIGNIDNSNCAWIFVSDGSQYVYAYDCNLNLKWKSTALSADPRLLGLADFDGDGKSELYCRDEILAAESGIRIVKGTNSGSAAGGPVAVDILDAAGNVSGVGDNKLELVSGCNIFSVNLGARTLNSGSLTLKKKAAGYFYWEKNGNTTLTSVADYNQDGFLDVISTGSTGSQSANATAFFWDVKNNVVTPFIDAFNTVVTLGGCSGSPPASGTFYQNGWQNGMGRINIADIDGNGKLNASYISGRYMYALDENFKLMWRINVNEETSGYTGCTVYDFNGDGAAEVVYRDEQYLYIINGKDGSINTQQQCIARTNFEYPVVADLDADGQTELCVTCGFDDAAAWSNFCNLGYSENSCVRVFSSASVPWVPSRKLWNQHAYFNVNVNDNLTIPINMQKQLAVFSSGVCTIGQNRALNSFLNQSPFLDSKGCPTYAAPDLVNVQSQFKVTPPVCPNTDFTVSMVVQNIGDATIQGSVPVTFYKGDPTLVGALKLNTVTVPVNLTKGQSQTFSGITVTGTGGNFQLYISLNDAGTTVPTPIKLPNTPFIECNYNNLISANVVSSSGHVVAEKISDNIKCIGAAVPDNGSADAYFDMGGGVKNTIDYDFKWYNGAVSGTPNFAGAVYSGLAAGTYHVIAINKATGCSSDTASVTIAQVPKAPLTATIIVDQPNSSCSSPNGKFHVVVNAGDPVNNYSYAWYESNVAFTTPIIGTGNAITNLKGGVTYTVAVTDISSGCQTLANLAVPDVTVNPVVSQGTIVNANCAPPNTGSASATVGGSTAGFTFDWYNGTTTKPTSDFTGSIYSAIPAGSYTVVATDNTSGCKSAPLTVQVNLPPPFKASAAQLTQQTSCDPANPDGSTSANVGGVTAGYTFNWFKGQSTAPADAIPGPTGLASGTYTVKATNTTTGCTDTAMATVTQKLIYPVVTLTPSPNATCSTTLGSSTYTGSVTAAVTYNGAAVGAPFTNYSFVWHQGALATDPVIAGATSSSINLLNGGNYTLVVSRTDLACPAAPVTAVVTNTPTLPVITTNQTPSTNCVPGKENGLAEVTQVNGTAVGATANFGYQWYTGAGVGSIIAGQTLAQLKNVQGGAGDNYTVQVTDKTTGCQNAATVLVADARVLPKLSLVETDNTVCNPALMVPVGNYNGTTTATVTNQIGPVSDYVFTWHDGALVTDPVDPGSTTTMLTKLNGGTYTVRTQHTPTGCVSSASSVVVKNKPTLPAIVTNASASTNCVAGKEDGQAKVTSVDGTAVGAAVGYVYSWAGPAAPAFPVTNATNNASTSDLIKLQGGPGYNYVVTVTNQSSGCTNTATVNVPDATALPVLSLAKTDNSVCSPALMVPAGNYNGTETATVTNQIGLLSDYVFTWHDGALVTDPVDPGSTAATLTQLNGGTYSVTALHTVTGCVSSPASKALVNISITPVITTSTTPSTNCDPLLKNGSASVTNVDGAGVGVPYQFAWYDGNAVAGPVKSAVKDYNNVQGGAGQNYTVQVTNQSNGCQNTKTVLVGDNSVLPALSLASAPNSICDAALTSPAVTYNGSETASVTNQIGLISDYVFTWHDGPLVTDPLDPGSTGVALNNLNGGTYTVTAKHSPTGCVSAPVSKAVTNTPALPAIATATTPSTNCVAGKEDGIAKVTTVDGVAAPGNYTYQWYTGTTIVAGNAMAGQTTQQISSQQGGAAGNFAVLVTNKGTGCQNNISVNITDGKQNPVLVLSVLTNNTVCDTVNLTPTGALKAAVSANGVGVGSPLPANYMVTWSPIPTKGTHLANDTYDHLHSGSYSAHVVNNNTGCQSANDTKSILDNLTLPVIAIATTPQTSCNAAAPNGKLDATGDGANNSATHDFTWYQGSGTGGSTVAQTGTVGEIASLVSGNYTIQINIKATGCVATQTGFVPDNIVNPSLTFGSVNPVTSCSTPNGSATVTINALTAPTKYDLFYVFTSSASGAAYPTDPLVIKASGDPKNITNGTTPPIAYGGMIPGYLSAVAVDKNTSCETPPVTQQINDATTKSNINVTLIPVPGVCGGGKGGIDPIVTPLPAASYTYEWFRGSPTNAGTINFFNNLPTFGAPQIYGDNGPNLGINHAPSDLTIGVGTYTLVAIETATGCGTYHTDNVPTTSLPKITVTPTDITKCGAPNGQITADVVAGTSLTYSIDIYQGNDATGVHIASLPASPTGTPLSTLANLAEGAYFIKVIDSTEPGCPMGVGQALVKKVLDPIITINIITPNTSCDPANFGDGSIKLTVTKDSRDPTVPNYQVTNIDKPTHPAYGFPIAVGPSGSSVTLTGFEPQTYTITLTDNVSTCNTNAVVNFPNQANSPTGMTVAITNDEFCAPTSNGQVSVTSVTTGTPSAVTDYSYEWYQDAALTMPAYKPGYVPLSEIFDKTKSDGVNPGWGFGATNGLGNGTRQFFVRGRREVGTGVGCYTPVVEADVLDIHVAPVSSFIVVGNTSCTGLVTGEGSIAITTATSSPTGAINSSTYTYSWAADPNAQSPQTNKAGYTIANLGTANYNVTSLNEVSGCLVANAVAVPFTPFSLSITQTASVAQFLCSPDGEADVNQVVIDRSSQSLPNLTFNSPLAADFNINWYAATPGNPGTFNSATPLQDNTPAVINSDKLQYGVGAGQYATIGAGTYYAIATRKPLAPGAGCAALPVRIDIQDKHVNPAVALTPANNTSCDANFEGKITVNASGGPGTYTYTWDPTNPVVVPNSAGNSGVANSTAANLQDGIYKLTVTNSVTSCVTLAQTTVLKSATPVVVANASEIDKKICAPDGSITIGPNDVLVNGVADPAHANFVFEWRQGSATGVVVGANADFLSTGNFPTIGAGDYFVTAARNTGVPVGSGCKSAPLKVTINDVSVNPTVSLTAFTNTACDTNYEGKITVNASDSGGLGVGKTYVYTWDPANPVVIANSAGNNGAANSTAANLKDGVYKITVTNSVTSCVTPAQTTLLQSNTPVLAVIASTVNQAICNPDGSITIGSIMVNNVVDPNHNNFVYNWYQSSLASPPIVTGTGTPNDVLNIGNFPAIGKGTYFVTATRLSGVQPGSGCVSPPLRVDINDVSINPVLSFLTNPNSACDNNFDGKITVTATDATGPGNGKNYDFNWTTIPGASSILVNPINNIPSPYATTAGDKVGPGKYVISVRNTTTNCVTQGTTDVLSTPPSVAVLTVSETDQKICNPDGQIIVSSVSPNTVADYTFLWFKTDPTTPPLKDVTNTIITSATLDKTNFPTMAAGIYFVQGAKLPGNKPGSGCVTAPFEVQVKDVHVDPVIAAETINDDVNCAGAAGATGKITINEATPANYTYNWFTGDDTTGTPVAVAAPGNIAQGLFKGDYTVKVTSNASNCFSLKRYTISNNPTIVDFDPAGFSAPAVTTCVLATGAPSNGSATVTIIRENNVSVPLANYTFLWQDALSNTLQSGASPALPNIPPGTYFVKATNTTSNCFTDLSFTVDDKTIGSTTVTLINFQQPVKCVDPTTGSLSVQGGGTVAGPYTYEWYTGDQRPKPAGALLTAPGPPLPAAGILSNIPIAAGQIYTAKVINSNNCWAVDAYSVPLIVTPIVIRTSSSPNTYCSISNGEVAVAIANLNNTANYNYYWATGNVATVVPPANYQGNDITNLPDGDYSVIAIDMADPGCVSPVGHVNVQKQQVIPVVTPHVLQSLTNCDPLKPNGVASADVGGNIANYTFDWFKGNAVAGAPFYTGAQVDSLTAIVYTVRATTLISGCAGTASVTIPNQPNKPPKPTLVVVQNVTSCVRNNGILSVSVNGVTKDYVFDWATGTGGPPPIVFTGEIYDSLAVGDYSVIATSRITGCVSDPVTKPIILDQVKPDFNFLIEPALCPDNPNKFTTVPPPTSGTGYVSLLVNDKLPIATVSWYHDDGTFISQGSNLENALPGTYKVKVVTTLGCQNEKTIEVPVEILVYNGISRRQGSQNNYFAINCLDRFENNHVEIFNRAGTKVYEADHYDNNNVLFDGVSNRGINLMGNHLPAGTYFYIISKGDGSNRIVGYLELVD